MAAGTGRGQILPADTPAPVPWAPGQGHSWGFAPDSCFWVHKQGCSRVSWASNTLSHTSHGPWRGTAPDLTPPKPPAHFYVAFKPPTVPPTAQQS